MDAANHPTIGCTFSTDEAAVAALQALSDGGLASTLRVGARDHERASKLAADFGATANLDPTDPLAGIPGLASGADAAAGVNAGAVTGGVVGAIAGFISGSTPLAAIMPVDPSARTAAATLFFFIVGVAVGGVLGGAFGRRPSTHAGFRLIDAMEAGDVALLASVEEEHLNDVRRTLESAGASDIIAIEARRAR